MTRVAASVREAWPSRSEMERLLERHGTISATAVVIGRSVTATKNIVDELGVAFVPTQATMSESATRFGWEMEDHAADVLGAKIVRRRDPTENPFDLIWNGLRLDVKAARPRPNDSRRPDYLTWSFRLASKTGRRECDAFFCVLCDVLGKPQRYLLIPAAEAPAFTISVPVTLRSKWARYLWVPDQLRSAAA